MGVDVRITLPGNVRVKDVAIVLAALDGASVTKRDLVGGSYAARCEAVDVKGLPDLPECAEITWEGTSGARRWLYHYEFDGMRLLMPRSTDWNIAAGRRLIRFFGGKLDYNDCDSGEWNEVVRNKPNSANCPSDGAPWHKLQDRLLAVTPLTTKEITEAAKRASYISMRAPS